MADEELDPEFDAELLIHAVQERVVLWDKSIDDYKNRNLTTEAWKEVGQVLVDKFEEYDEQTKIKIVKAIQRKWTNLRDAWLRAEKKRKEEHKSGSGKPQCKKYIFYDEMLFLNKVTELRETTSSLQGPEQEAETNTPVLTNRDTHQNKATVKRKKAKPDILEQEILEELRKPEEKKNPRMAFLESLLPHISHFTEAETLEFQMGTLNLIQKMQQARLRQTALYTDPSSVPNSISNLHSPYPQYSPNPSTPYPHMIPYTHFHLQYSCQDISQLRHETASCSSVLSPTSPSSSHDSY